MATSRFGQTIPEGGVPGEPEARLHERCKELVHEYEDYLQQFEFRKATQTLRALWSAGNLYLDERAPWHLIKQDRDATAMVLRTAINFIGLIALASWPVIPFTSEKLFESLHLTPDERKLLPADVLSLDRLQANRSFDVPPPLFRKIDDAEVLALSEQYGGV
jgi:methionyl-tRNA synthetase